MDITPFQYTIRDKNTLQAAYMPFVKNGGLFLKGVTLSMGYPVGIILELPNDIMKYGVDGKVVWIATGANQGVGVQLLDSPTTTAVSQKIEQLLVGTDRNKANTFTL